MEGLLPDLELLRLDFPILTRELAGGHPLVYLDSANTSQKPQVVIDTMVDHLERHNANVARAMHQLGAESSEAFEAARDKVAAFIKAPSRDEVIFTKNASEALNLVANTLAWPGEYAVGPGSDVVITEMEHHSNIVPWQLLTQRTGATLRWFGLTDDGQLDLSNIDSLITERTKVVSLTWVSNMLGTINPIAEIARRAHEVGAIVVVDASQAAPQLPDRCRGVWCRCPGLHGTQDSRADRHRRAVGSTRSARRSAAVPRWWRDDRDGHDGAVDVRPDSAQVRGRHTADRGSGRAWRSAGLPVAHRARRDSCPRAGHHGVRPRRAGHGAGTEGVRPVWTPRLAAAPSRSRSRACIPTTLRRCSTPEASRFAPATTAQSLPMPASGCNRRRGCRRTSTRPRPRSTPSSRDCTSRCPTSVFSQRLRRGERDGSGRAVPGDHPRSLPQAAPRGTSRAVRCAGAPRQSDVWRRSDPAGPAWVRTTRSSMCRTTRWVARSRRLRPRS